MKSIQLTILTTGSRLGTSRTAANSRKRTKPHYSVVSMFSGIGGLDLGLEGGFEFRGSKYKSQPFEVIAAYEKDEKCVATVRHNLEIPIIERALSPDDVSSLPSADVLIGGFPCQDFSSCGPKRGLSSERGNLYRVMVNYMREHQPLIVCAENVPHLARMHGGQVLETIKKDFAEAGYKVQVWDLYAPDYGVPQNRRRLFFICTHEDLVGEPEKPKAAFAQTHRSTKWAIEDLRHNGHASIPNQDQFFKASKAKRGNGQGDETCKADEPSYTIRANAKSRVQFHYAEKRRLTVRECARLQTFPDSFLFPHSPTTSIMQIGNAVPPVLAHAVGGSLARFLDRAVKQ